MLSTAPPPAGECQECGCWRGLSNNIFDLLFKASAESVLTIAADPKHLGAHIGITAVLHTLGSTMTHHPHIQ